MVSPGPLSRPSEGGGYCGLEESDELTAGFRAHGTVLTQEGGVWESGVWLLGGGVAWGNTWLGRRPAEPMVKVARALWEAG